ncbi:MAG: hypothetical protein ABJ275_11440 [Maricaulaceae bacterium]
MKTNVIATGILALCAMISTSVLPQTTEAKPGNCKVYAQMSAETVKKDSRFKGHDNIVPALMKFANAQTAKMKAGMAETYKQSKAYGWDKAKVDSMMEEGAASVRASFFSSTMDKNKLYMNHVQAVYSCGQAQTTPADLGQSIESFTTVLQKMAEIVRS